MGWLRGAVGPCLVVCSAEQVEDVMNANTHTKAERRLRIVRATEKEDSWENASDEENPTGKEGGADDNEVCVCFVLYTTRTAPRLSPPMPYTPELCCNRCRQGA